MVAEPPIFCTGNDTLETSVPGCYAVGDGAGQTRGLVPAPITGILVGRDIAPYVENCIFGLDRCRQGEPGDTFTGSD